MNLVKFDLMVREFPFVGRILKDRHLDADSIVAIEVKRADQNLLEVTPFAEAADLGSGGDYSRSRIFWCVTVDNQVENLKSAWQRFQVPHGVKHNVPASPIGTQLLATTQAVEFIVEVSSEDCNDGDGEIRRVVIYRMQGFDWRKYGQHLLTIKTC